MMHGAQLHGAFEPSMRKSETLCSLNKEYFFIQRVCIIRCRPPKCINCIWASFYSSNMVSWFQFCPLSSCSEGYRPRESSWSRRHGRRGPAPGSQQWAGRVSGAWRHCQENQTERQQSQPDCHLESRAGLLQSSKWCYASVWWYSCVCVSSVIWSFFWICLDGHFSTFVP